MQNLSLIKNQKGQSVIEYILLLGVVMTIGMTVFKSDAFTKLFGSDSQVFAIIRKQVEYSYRHGSNGVDDLSTYTTSNHENYFYKGGGDSRFFAPSGNYPNP